MYEKVARKKILILKTRNLVMITESDGVAKRLYDPATNVVDLVKAQPRTIERSG